MASNYEQLVKALRHCSKSGVVKCNGCEYYGKEWPIGCMEAMMRDAAAVIDALRKRLVSALTALHLANEKMGYYGIQPYTEADGEDMISDWVKTIVHEELKQQLPKRGEWELQASGQDCKCSVCESYWIPFGDEYDYKFCPNCGAKMNDSNASNASNALNALDNAQDGLIVRCGECLHYNAGFECLAEGYGIERDPDWFCADGERKVQE